MNQKLIDALLAADRGLYEGRAGRMILPDVIARLETLSTRIGQCRAMGFTSADGVEWQEQIHELVRSLRAAARDGGVMEMLAYGREMLQPLVAPIVAELESVA